MEKRFRNGDSDVSVVDFAADVQCVIVDEVHQAKADVLKKLLTGVFANVPIRWGLKPPLYHVRRVPLHASIQAAGWLANRGQIGRWFQSFRRHRNRHAATS